MDENWLQQRDWEVYLALEARQRNALWAFLGFLGLVLVAIAGRDVDVFGASIPATTFLATAPFFVFFMGGRFYFVSAYLVIAFSRVVHSAATANKDAQFRDICRRLVIPDIATGLNLYAPNVTHNEATKVGVWLFLTRLAFVLTKVAALSPFIVHIGFTIWFYQASGVSQLNAYTRIAIVILYVTFFIGAIVMCEYLRRITEHDRAMIYAKLSAESC